MGTVIARHIQSIRFLLCINALSHHHHTCSTWMLVISYGYKMLWAEPGTVVPGAYLGHLLQMQNNCFHVFLPTLVSCNQTKSRGWEHFDSDPQALECGLFMCVCKEQIPTLQSGFNYYHTFQYSDRKCMAEYVARTESVFCS